MKKPIASLVCATTSPDRKENNKWVQDEGIQIKFTKTVSLQKTGKSLIPEDCCREYSDK